MGVRGLTTFILQRKEIFLEEYELPQNSCLVIDGNSMALNIFLSTFRKRSAICGGDYDIYANAVNKFFKMLLACKITAYVIFDGATEKKKNKVIMKRVEEMLKASLKITCDNEADYTLFPLCLPMVFREVLKKLEIAAVNCDFECDREAATIAKQLNCPVLAFDSDYFIFDVQYIPCFCDVDGTDLNVYKKFRYNANKKNVEMNLSCKIFNKSKFLAYTKLPEEMLPILAVYLGNDYITRPNNRFFCNLNIRASTIYFTFDVINYLAFMTCEKAIDQVIQYYLKRGIYDNSVIFDTLETYKNTKTEYMHYLNKPLTDKIKYTFGEYLKKVPKQFIQKYRRCWYD